MTIKNHYQDDYAKINSIEHIPRLQKSIKLAHKYCKNKDSFILDIGCGDGYITSKFGDALSSGNLYGVDISFNAKNDAFKNHNIKMIAHDLDTGRLSLNDGMFDFIFCGCLIELVQNPDHLLEEIQRLLKDDGIAIINNPNMNSWASRIAVFFGYLPYYGRVSTKYDLGKLGLGVSKGVSTGFIRLFPTKVLRKLLILNNFKVIKTVGAADNSMPAGFKFFDNFFSNFPSLAFQNIWVIKKNKI